MTSSIYSGSVGRQTASKGWTVGLEGTSTVVHIQAGLVRGGRVMEVGHVVVRIVAVVAARAAVHG